MIKIICVGKVKEQYLRDGINDYVKRIGKYHKINIIEVEDSNMNEERDRIIKHIDNRDFVITLEIDGNQIDSISFADKINKVFITNPTITFIIGGSYGLHDDIKKRSNYKLSFSKFTFPHQLFRVILLEQIYRVFKIMNNETYHK